MLAVYPYIFGASLLAFASVTWRSDATALRRTALAMAGNWLACMLAVRLSGIADFALAFVLIDALTAWAVLARPAGRVQAVVGGIYLVQIAFHIAYFVAGLFGLGWSPWLYLTILSGAAAVQLTIMVGGGGGGISRWVSDVRRRRAAARLAWRAGHAGMAGRGR